MSEVRDPPEERTVVGDYMTKSVDTLDADITVGEAIVMILDSPHHGMPVVRDGMLIGFVTAKALLRHRDKLDRRLEEVIEEGPIVGHPDMKIEDAARIIFRYGFRTLPVVATSGELVGVLSTIDVMRSHIERSTPRKLDMVRKLLEDTYHVKVAVSRRTVPIGRLRPTQKYIHADELSGREYELRKGLAEPLIVIRKRTYYVLVDGHHRVIAARNIGMEEMDAYVLEFDQDVLLGMEKQADRIGLHALDDIEIVQDAQHPLIEVTTRLLAKKRDGG